MSSNLTVGSMVTKTKLVKQTIEGEIVEDVLCNICGKSLHPEGVPLGNYEGLEARFCGGYGSLLGDGIEYEFAICETCLKDKIFPMFKHPPKENDHLFLGGIVEDTDLK